MFFEYTPIKPPLTANPLFPTGLYLIKNYQKAVVFQPVPACTPRHGGGQRRGSAGRQAEGGGQAPSGGIPFSARRLLLKQNPLAGKEIFIF